MSGITIFDAMLQCSNTCDIDHECLCCKKFQRIFRLEIKQRPPPHQALFRKQFSTFHTKNLEQQKVLQIGIGNWPLNELDTWPEEREDFCSKL